MLRGTGDALHRRGRCAPGAPGAVGGPCASRGQGSPEVGVEAYPGGCSGARSSPGGGLHRLPGGPHRGLTGAGGEHLAPPAAGSTVGQDAAPVLPNRLGWLALGLWHHRGTPGCKGSWYPALLRDHGAAWPPVSRLGPPQPPCTPKCLGLPVAGWQPAPNAGCSALGSPPSRCRAAAGWEQPILVGPAAVGTPQQPATLAPPWVLALGDGSTVGHFSPVSPVGPGWTCSSSCANRTLADKGTAGAARETLPCPTWPRQSPPRAPVQGLSGGCHEGRAGTCPCAHAHHLHTALLIPAVLSLCRHGLAGSS